MFPSFVGQTQFQHSVLKEDPPRGKGSRSDGGGEGGMASKVGSRMGRVSLVFKKALTQAKTDSDHQAYRHFDQRVARSALSNTPPSN